VNESSLAASASATPIDLGPKPHLGYTASAIDRAAHLRTDATFLAACEGDAATGGYLIAVRRVNEAGPRVPIPAWRVAAWLAGLAAILIALTSAVDVYAEDLLGVHMVQHLLLAMVAPPLLAIGAPVTLLLRIASPAVRHRVILPLLHSRAVRLVASPLVAWPLFAMTMWLTHFSPIYNMALEDPVVHLAEHLAGGSEGGGQVAAHAGDLAALARKDEGVDRHLLFPHEWGGIASARGRVNRGGRVGGAIRRQRRARRQGRRAIVQFREGPGRDPGRFRRRRLA